MSRYKITCDMLGKIMDYIGDDLNVAIDLWHLDKKANAKYFPRRDEAGIIVVICRLGNDENLDSKLALVLHEAGHCILEHKELEEDNPCVRLQKERQAWERGWRYVKEIIKKEDISLDLEQFKSKYERMEKTCLKSYEKRMEANL